MRRTVAALSAAAAAAAAALLLAAGPALAHEEIEPGVFPTAKPTFFTLAAANEKTVALTKVTLTAPDGLPFGTATNSPAGWTAARTDTVVTWTGGSVAPGQFAQWGFEIEGADQPGTLTYKVGLGFADGSSDDVDVTVTATSGDTAAGPAASSNRDPDSKASVAVVVGVLALVLAAIATVLAVRKKGAGAGPAAGGAQGKDW